MHIASLELPLYQLSILICQYKNVDSSGYAKGNAHKCKFLQKRDRAEGYTRKKGLDLRKPDLTKMGSRGSMPSGATVSTITVKTGFRGVLWLGYDRSGHKEIVTDANRQSSIVIIEVWMFYSPSNPLKATNSFSVVRVPGTPRVVTTSSCRLKISNSSWKRQRLHLK
jgi:hypothetical protein